MFKEQILHFDHAYPRVSTALQALLGSLFMAILAQITIPLKPVPMSLQTLGVFMLPMMMNKRVAAYSMVLYLVEASLGMPVLSSMKVNPLWIAGPTAGYLLSFPVAAYVIGALVEKGSSLIWSATSLLVGQVIIYIFGVGVLAMYLGFEKAFYVGFVPFISVSFYKVGLALAATKLYKKIL